MITNVLPPFLWFTVYTDTESYKKLPGETALQIERDF